MKKHFISILATLFCLCLSSQTIPMERIGRTYQIPCTVNGLKLTFILDTGAENVSISLAEALFMLKNGYLNERDLLNTEFFRIANGDIIEGTKIVIRSIEIGGLTIRNVEASIMHSIEAPLLFGQSALEKLGKVTVDYKNNKLIIGEQKVVYATIAGSYLEYYISGNSKLELGDFIGAIQDYNKVIELSPNFSDAYISRGITKSYLNDYRGAIQDYKKAIELNPNFSDVYINMGVAKGNLNDYRGAIQDYNKAMEINPDEFSTYYNRGNAKGYLNDHHGAIQDYKKAIELNPNYANSYVNMGIAKGCLNDYRGAIQVFNKAIEVNSIYYEAYYNRGLAKGYLNDYRGALQDYNKAIEINPDDYSTYYNRGIIKMRLSDINGACLDWSKAGELGKYDAYELISEYCN